MRFIYMLHREDGGAVTLPETNTDILRLLIKRGYEEVSEEKWLEIVEPERVAPSESVPEAAEPSEPSVTEPSTEEGTGGESAPRSLKRGRTKKNS